MYPVDTFRRTLEKFIAILNIYEIKFHLTGGVTNIAYSEPRMTQGIDIVVNNDALLISNLYIGALPIFEHSLLSITDSL